METYTAHSQSGHSRRPRGLANRPKATITAFAALALIVPLFIGTTAGETPSYGSTVSVMEDSVPQALVDPDTVSVELGATFTTSQNGTVSAIRFYKSEKNTGPHVVNLWSPQGKVLATATLPDTGEKNVGWQTVTLPTPVAISKDQKYVASYIAPHGRYSADEQGLKEAQSDGPLTILAGGGVYAYGEGGVYPSSSYKNSNYYVDVVFTASTSTTSPTPTAPATTTPPTVAPTTAPATTTPPTVAPTTAPATTTPTGNGGLPDGVTVRNVDGGLDYYSKFNSPLPVTSDYFPIAVWYESVLESADVNLDKAAGINTYLELTANSDTNLVKQAGMYAITSWKALGQSGTLMPDEVDMWAGPGLSTWTGNWPGQGAICAPANAQCGYTIQAAQKTSATAGSMLFANYGKGVTFWETDSQAAKFVNDYPDVISDDNYWFTDPNICGISEGGNLVSPQRQLTDDECRKGANYGWTIDRLRSLVQPQGSKPIWAFVEVGHPFSEDWAPTITGPQIKAAVWSSLIHGARGVTYFNHNFGGDCQSQHVLRDSCGTSIRPAVTEVNAQIKALAPVLNSPYVDGAATSNDAIDTSVRVNKGNLYVFAASTKSTNQQVTIHVECSNASTATVLGESRNVAVNNGVISDTFADGNAVHLYALNGSNACGL